MASDEFFAFIHRGYIPPPQPPDSWPTADTVVYGGVMGPWFLESLVRASRLAALHYAVLPPPEQLCLERVGDRVGHGFTDLDAASHVYKEFASAGFDRRHMVTSADDAATIASQLSQLLGDGSLSWPGPGLSPAC